MSDAKLDISFGSIRFSGEGSEQWLEAQLEKMFHLIPTLPQIPQADTQASTAEIPTGMPSLAVFLKQKNVTGNQNRRFLATAVWLKQTGQKDLKTAVTKALADAHQQRLGNPSDTLNKNVARGFCVKQGDGFYVTPEGEAEIG